MRHNRIHLANAKQSVDSLTVMDASEGKHAPTIYLPNDNKQPNIINPHIQRHLDFYQALEKNGAMKL
jgi:hypothetical protein